MGCQCSKEAGAPQPLINPSATTDNKPPMQAPAMLEGGSKATIESKSIEQPKTVVMEHKADLPVAAIAPQVTEVTVSHTHENLKPNNTDPSAKISASKKKRMKKKAAKAAKATTANQAVDGSEDVSEDGSYIEEPTKKEFVEAMSSANQSYEAYYSADSEAPGDIRGRARR